MADKTNRQPAAEGEKPLAEAGQAVKDAGQSIKETAADAGQRVKETAVDAGQRVKETALSVANEAQQKLGDVTAEAKQSAESVVSQQKEMVADRVSSFADAVRQTGRQLQEQNESTIGEYAQNFAGQLDRFAGYLQRSEINDLLGEVRGLARRQPELFLAGSIAAGFLLGRFLKSSAGASDYRSVGYRNMDDGSRYDMDAGGRYEYPPTYGSQYDASPRYGYASGYGSDSTARYSDSEWRSQGWRTSQDHGAQDYGAQDYDAHRENAQGASSYPDLAYRDPMRGDAPTREDLYGQGQSGVQGYDDTNASGAMDSSQESTRGSQST